MTFVQLEFLAFFAIVFPAYWMGGRREWQNAILCVSSAVFYGWVHPWFLGLLGFSAVLDFISGRAMEDRPKQKGTWLTISLIGNLGMLGFFKYYNFFVDNFAAALGKLGVLVHLPTLQIALPVGISFYTFQTLSYTIDVYRGRLKARRNWLDYLTFILMFPHLVAGPVMKAVDLLPQLEQTRTFDWGRLRSGLTLALWGAAKKVMIADTVSLYVDRVFAIQTPPTLLVGVATLGFAIQILADFSGYTDIARGTARMMGIELMLNFDHPYIATNPSDFWRRWHISFSRWIHEYVYEPMRGGSPSSARRTFASYGSLLASGLWHGASWNYVLWGFWHASLLTGYRLVTPMVPAALRESKAARTLLGTPLMFGFTLFGWLLFRETDLSRIGTYVTTLPTLSNEANNIVAALLLGVFLTMSAPMVAVLLIEKYLKPRLREPWLLPAQAVGWALCIIAIVLFARDTQKDFIYFAF